MQQPQGSEALAPAAGRAPQAALVQAEGFATQQRLALQTGEMLLVPGHPLCPLKLLREDDLRDKHSAAHFRHPTGAGGPSQWAGGGGPGPGCRHNTAPRVPSPPRSWPSSSQPAVPRPYLIAAGTARPQALAVVTPTPGSPALPEVNEVDEGLGAAAADEAGRVPQPCVARPVRVHHRAVLRHRLLAGLAALQERA